MPDIRVGSGDSASAPLNETNAGLTADGKLTVTDVDTTDVISTTVTTVTGPTGGISNADLLGMFSVTPDSGLAANTGDANNLTWNFNSGSEAFNYLRAGQSLQLTYTLTVNDGNLGTDTQTVTVTITGTNDAPVLSDTTDPVAVLELGDASAQNLAPITGNFSVTDLDAGDTLDASVVGGATVLLNGNPFVLPAGASALIGAGAFSVIDTVSNGGAVNIGYSYDPSAANLDFLRAGDSLTITYTVQVNDGTANSGTQDVTFTITGTNDAPVLSDTTDPTAVAELGDASAQNLDAITGNFSVTDKDFGDTLTASVVGSPVVLLNGGAFVLPGGASALTAAGAFTLDPAFLSSGTAQNVGYSYDPGAANLDFLRAGQSLTITYTVQVSDGTATSAQDVTFTITGTNDAPVLSDTIDPIAVAELGDASAQNLSAITGSFSVTDLDVGDTLTATVVGSPAVLLNGGAFVLPGGASALTDAGAFTLDPAFSSNGAAQNVGYSYDPGAANLDFLRAGDSLTITYTIQVGDGTTNSGTQTVTFTITGTNDVPALSDTTDPTAVLELGDASAQNLAPITGNFSVTDLDNGDTLDASLVGGATVLLNGNPFLLPAGASALTAAGAFTVTDTVSNGGAVNIGYSYDPGAANLDFLSEGESLTITYTVRVNDGTTNSGTQDVTFTITGTNDAPVLTVDATGGVTEDASDPTLTDSGTLSFTDADTTDTHVVSSVYNDDAVWTGGSLSAGQIAAISGGFSADSSGWDYSVANSALDFLAAGETITLSFNVTVTDDSGALNNSDTEVVTLTITGTNDAPVLTGDLAAPINEGGSYQLTTADVNFTDPDDVAANVTFTATGLSNGTLYVNGIAQNTFTGADLAAGLVTFTHDGSETLTAGFSISVEDGNEDSSAPVSQPFNFTVSPVNDAPVNTVPGGQSVNEDQTQVFSTGNGNAISISDVDAGSNTVQVTLSVASGTLTLGSLVGLTVTAGANGSSTVTVQGTQAAINAGLDGLTYQGNLNFNGGDSLSIVTSDLGNGGSGGTLTDTDNVAITVNAVNDAPVNTVPAGQAVNEDQTLVFSTGNGNAISIGDVDAGGNVVQVALSVASGALGLGSLAGLTVTSGANGSSTVTVQGTIADINAALQGLSYQGNLNFNGGDSLSIVTSDLGNSGSGGTQTDTDNVAITVNAVNDAPVNNTPASFSTNEDNALKLAGLSVTDVDAGAGNISVTLSVVSGTLTAANAGGVSVSGSGTGSITLSGTLAAINSYLATVANQPTYTPVANASGAVTLTMTTNDGGNTGSGGAQSDTDNVTITVNAVNDAPVASPITLTAIAEDSGPRIITQAELLAGVTDVDGPSLSITALSIATGLGTLINNGNGTWTFTPAIDDDTSVTFNYTASDGSLTSNSTATMDITPVADSLPPTDITFTLATSTGGITGSNIGNGTTLGSFSAVDPDSSSWTFTIGSVVGQTLPAVTFSPATGGSVNLVTNGAIGAGNYQFTVTATDAQGQSFVETYTLSVGTAGADGAAVFTISAGTDLSFGLNGADTINGGAGDDALVGGQNADTLNGGLGNDQLVGGAGGDNFLFNTVLSGTTNVDRVLDFDAGGGPNGDHIQLDDAIFTQLSVGTLSAANFVANAGGVAGDANDYILYDTLTGNLYYDADGNGAGARVLFATITVAAGTIDPTDILIV